MGTLEDQTELAVRDYKYREFVVQKNELIQRVRNNLTERELKLLEFMISRSQQMMISFIRLKQQSILLIDYLDSVTADATCS
ncbi:hypothetical protein QY890_00095 [Latilactobacillus sakei]